MEKTRAMRRSERERHTTQIHGRGEGERLDLAGHSGMTLHVLFSGGCTMLVIWACESMRYFSDSLD